MLAYNDRKIPLSKKGSSLIFEKCSCPKRGASLIFGKFPYPKREVKMSLSKRGSQSGYRSEYSLLLYDVNKLLDSHQITQNCTHESHGLISNFLGEGLTKIPASVNNTSLCIVIKLLSGLNRKMIFNFKKEKQNKSRL